LFPEVQQLFILENFLFRVRKTI